MDLSRAVYSRDLKITAMRALEAKIDANAPVPLTGQTDVIDPEG